MSKAMASASARLRLAAAPAGAAKGFRVLHAFTGDGMICAIHPK